MALHWVAPYSLLSLSILEKDADTTSCPGPQMGLRRVLFIEGSTSWHLGHSVVPPRHGCQCAQWGDVYSTLVSCSIATFLASYLELLNTPIITWLVDCLTFLICKWGLVTKGWLGFHREQNTGRMAHFSWANVLFCRKKSPVRNSSLRWCVLTSTCNAFVLLWNFSLLWWVLMWLSSFSFQLGLLAVAPLPWKQASQKRFSFG